MPFQIKGETLEKMNLAERMKHHRVPGTSIAVINNGKIEWVRGYGVKEVRTNLPVTSDTLFQAASISKPLAAIAALKWYKPEGAGKRFYSKTQSYATPFTKPRRRINGERFSRI